MMMFMPHTGEVVIRPVCSGGEANYWRNISGAKGISFIP